MSSVRQGEGPDKSDNTELHSRRDILQMGVAAMAAGSLSACIEPSGVEPTDKQRALKRKGTSRVHLSKVESYANLSAALELAWNAIGPEVRGKSIFLKINLVDFREKIPVCTSPEFVDACVAMLKKKGVSKLQLGDGPALNRDTEEIARLSGIAEVCRKHEVEFVDLNIDDLKKVENPLNFTGVKEFLLPVSVCDADLLISVPKLKTHHWALMTCSMKNMFGVVPGRKYGWPKNILHVKGINISILDILSSCKPGFAIVDGIVALEGDGPLNGTAKQANILAMGDDLVAVDTVCASLMGLSPGRLKYLQLGGMVLGENNLASIKISGEAPANLTSKFLLPPTFEADGSPRDLSNLSKAAGFGVT